jgi:hypothetical protein
MKRASGPTCCATQSRKAITSCLVTASIASIAATSIFGLVAHQSHSALPALRHNAQLAQLHGGVRLDLEPDAKRASGSQMGGHRGAGVAGDHAPASADAVATPASANAEQVAAVVDKDFPTYDADKSGQLDKAEFSKWVLTLKDAELKASGKTMAQTDLAAWASAAFTSADSDKSATVTKTELGKFLGA